MLTLEVKYTTGKAATPYKDSHRTPNKTHTPNQQQIVRTTYPSQVGLIPAVKTYLLNVLKKTNHHILCYCLRVSITMKRHHDHGNSYMKHLIGVTRLQFQRFSPLSSGQGAWLLGRVRGDVMLELRVLLLQTTGSRLAHWVVSQA